MNIHIAIEHACQMLRLGTVCKITQLLGIKKTKEMLWQMLLFLSQAYMARQARGLRRWISRTQSLGSLYSEKPFKETTCHLNICMNYSSHLNDPEAHKATGGIKADPS